MQDRDSAVPEAPSNGDLEALRQENSALKFEIGYLEANLQAQREQLDLILGSASWRVTSPVRMSTGRFRKLKGMMRSRTRRKKIRSAPIHGLFPPVGPTPNNVDVDRLIASPGSLSHPIEVELPKRDVEVLVYIHVYYPEMWPEFADLLASIPMPFDLVVSLVPDKSEGLTESVLEQFPGADVRCFANRGRDIGPFVLLANEGRFRGYEAVLKLHTKKSPHRIDGDGWRRRLTKGLVPSREGVTEFVETLKRSDDIGVIVPKGNVGGPEFWGSDLPIAEALASRMALAFDPDDLRFPAGSMYWIRPWIADRLADLCLTADDFDLESGQMDGTVAHGIERLIGIIASASGLQIVETNQLVRRPPPSPLATNRPMTLAYFLPQYHQVAENDEWWGEGFTDWANVDRGRPNFDSHNQPHVPRELGRYDLANPATLKAQSALVRDYGIDGLVFYHYWFGRDGLLRTPLELLLADSSIDLPFALCWANESWTRSWDGASSQILKEQQYPTGWVDDFYDDIRVALHDSRYLRVGGKPLLVVYRAGDVPEFDRAAARLRERAVADGHGGLHLLAVLPPPQFAALSASARKAVDGFVQFPPHTGIGLHSLPAAPGGDGFRGDLYSYAAAQEVGPELPMSLAGTPVYPGVFPGWDNTARRRENASIFHGSNPAQFRKWFAKAARVEAARTKAPPMVFINAWNEWAEGAHLEPCRRFGTGNLEAVLDVVGRVD